MFRSTFPVKLLVILLPLLVADEPSVLQPVEDLQAAQVTDATLVLTWTLSADMVSYLRQFEVCVVDAVTSSGDCFLTAVYSLSWGSKDPLRACTRYNASVSWRSVSMRESSSAEIAVTTLPQSVTELAAEEVGPTMFTVSWSLPADSASCVSSYKLFFCTPSGGCDLQGGDIPQSTTSYSFDDLQPCSSYGVVVTSQTQGGVQSSNASLTVATATQDPGPVQQLEVSQSGEGAVLVAWRPPDLQSCVGAYSVCASQLTPAAGPVLCQQVRGASTTTLAGLATCARLNVTVLPVDVDGQTSQATSTVLDIGVPSSVTGVRVADKTAASLDVQWGPPAQNANCTAGYSVCHRESFTSAELACGNTTALRYTVAGLSSATSYDVYVGALGVTGASPKYTVVRATTD